MQPIGDDDRLLELAPFCRSRNSMSNFPAVHRHTAKLGAQDACDMEARQQRRDRRRRFRVESLLRRSHLRRDAVTVDDPSTDAVRHTVRASRGRINAVGGSPVAILLNVDSTGVTRAPA
jgi:hypothetical protein